MSDMTLETPGDRAFYALSHATLPTLAALFDDLLNSKRAPGANRVLIHEALTEVYHLGCATFGYMEFTTVIEARPEAPGLRPQDGRAASSSDAVTTVDLLDLLDVLNRLFVEQQTTRLRMPFIVKELSGRLGMPQREIKGLLVDLRPLTGSTLYYEAASLGILRRDRQTKIGHYISIGGVYYAAIRMLDADSGR